MRRARPGAAVLAASLLATALLAGASPASAAAPDDHPAETPPPAEASGDPPSTEQDPAISAALAAVPPPVLDLHGAISFCEDPAGGLAERHPPVTAELSPVALLVAIPCTGDAAEATFRLYVLETGEIGGVHPLLFALPASSVGWAGTDLLRDVAVGADGLLTGTLRDPNQGRCVSRGAWRWNGFAFVLERAEVGEPCREGAPAGWRTVFPVAG